MSLWRISFLQIGTVTGTVGLQYWLLDSVGIFLPLGMLFLVTLATFYLGAKEDWPVRSHVLALVPKLAFLMWLFSLFAYVGCFLWNPSAFDFSISMLPLLAPIVSLAPALATVILTLCAGDTSLLMLGRS